MLRSQVNSAKELPFVTAIAESNIWLRALGHKDRRNEFSGHACANSK